MKSKLLILIGCIILFTSSCSDFDGPVEIPIFNFPVTVEFEQTLSAYSIFEGEPSNLIPTTDFHEIELSSVLFTDYAHKQRLIKLPEGTQMERTNDGSLEYPDGTILVKTFYYYNDEENKSLGKRIIESRLLIKENNTWNAATYVWNQDQNDAILTENGLETPVNWIDENGNNISIQYLVPTSNECIVCHQSSGSLTPLGPTLRNLNRMVVANGVQTNQIVLFQEKGLLTGFQIDQIPSIIDYKDQNQTLENRARAYLAMNCAHCHNPDAWQASAEIDFDFRYETPFNQTGLLFEQEKVIEAVQDQEMPFIGTTIIDTDGIELLVDYIESL